MRIVAAVSLIDVALAIDPAVRCASRWASAIVARVISGIGAMLRGSCPAPEVVLARRASRLRSAAVAASLTTWVPLYGFHIPRFISAGDTGAERAACPKRMTRCVSSCASFACVCCGVRTEARRVSV